MFYQLDSGEDTERETVICVNPVTGAVRWRAPGPVQQLYRLPGDRLLAVDGVPTDRDVDAHALLVAMAAVVLGLGVLVYRRGVDRAVEEL